MDVSVVIPCYNRRETIRAAVLSVLSQVGNHSIEVIVVDDGSNDDSMSQLDGLDVKIVSTGGRRGACYARNAGISMARYEWVAFNDSDDYWRIDKLEVIGRVVENISLDYVFHPFFREANGVFQFGGGYSKVSGLVDRVRGVKRILTKNYVSTQCLMVKKGVLKNINMFDVSFERFQDWDLAIRLFGSASGYFVRSPLVACVDSSNSISNDYKSGIDSRVKLKKKYSHFLWSIFVRRCWLYIRVIVKIR